MSLQLGLPCRLFPHQNVLTPFYWGRCKYPVACHEPCHLWHFELWWAHLRRKQKAFIYSVNHKSRITVLMAGLTDSHRKVGQREGLWSVSCGLVKTETKNNGYFHLWRALTLCACKQKVILSGLRQKWNLSAATSAVKSTVIEFWINFSQHKHNLIDKLTCDMSS